MINNQKPSLINPYELLGFDVKKSNINLKELKKNYYNLALMCHPDKGGDKNDMIILQNAYEYVKKQVELCIEKSHDFKETVDEFETFMKEQTKDPQPFSKVYEEAHIWLEEFNQKFNILLEENENDQAYVYNPLKDGYGSLMDPSEYNNKSGVGKSGVGIKGYQSNFRDVVNKPVQHQFDWELMVVDNFQGALDNKLFYELNQKEVDDFSCCGVADYRMAFTPANIKDTKPVKIEKPRATEVENKLEKLKTDRYLLDSELDERVIEKSFIMLDEEETKNIPIEYKTLNINNQKPYKKSRWF